MSVDVVPGLPLRRLFRGGLGRQRRYATGRRVDDQRRLVGLGDRVARVEPELVVVADDARTANSASRDASKAAASSGVKNAWSARSLGRSNGVSVRKSQTPFRSGAPQGVRGGSPSGTWAWATDPTSTRATISADGNVRARVLMMKFSYVAFPDVGDDILRAELGAHRYGTGTRVFSSSVQFCTTTTVGRDPVSPSGVAARSALIRNRWPSAVTAYLALCDPPE